MVQLQVNIEIGDGEKFNLSLNILAREDATEMEHQAARHMQDLIVGVTKAAAENEGLNLDTREINRADG